MKRIVLIIVILILAFSAGLLAFKAFRTVEPMAIELVKARIEPVGKVNVKTLPTTLVPQATLAVGGKPGEKIYETKCTVCHATGVAGAPIFGNAAAWKPRVAKGMNVLFDHVKNGYNAMPPKGTCMECTDEDLKAAIGYITGK